MNLNNKRGRRNWLKRLCALMLCLCMMAGGAVSANAATFSELNKSTVFVKQEGSGTCTLCSTVMMLRRRMIVDNRAGWQNITESALKATSSVWTSSGLSHSFSYNRMSVIYKSDLSSDYDTKVQQLIKLLKAHPEGIVLYDRTVPHAVLLTDYNNGVFYCADPAKSYPTGRIPITSSYKVTIEKASCYWYVSGSSTSTSSSGVTRVVQKDSDGVWYCYTNGKKDLSYTGFAENSNGWWYVEDGIVGFSVSTLVKGTVDGTYGWWYVVKNKVQLGTTTVAKRVDNGTWWYVKNGMVDFTFSGIAANSNGEWYIQDGKVIFSYYGTYKYNGVTYTISKGKVVSKE